MTIEELKAKIAAVEAGEQEGDIEALKAELKALEEAPPPAPTTEPPTAPPQTEPPPPPPAPTAIVDKEKATYKALALELLQAELQKLPETTRNMISEQAAGDPLKMKGLIDIAKTLAPATTAQPPNVNEDPAGGEAGTAVTLEQIRERARANAYE